MRGSELAKAMAVAVDRLVSAQEIFVGLDRAIETIVDTTNRFNGNDVTNYLEAVKAEMLMRDILDDRWFSGFSRIVTPSIHAKVLEIQADCRNWLEFKERLEKYGFNDSLRLSKRELMECDAPLSRKH